MLATRLAPLAAPPRPRRPGTRHQIAVAIALVSAAALGHVHVRLKVLELGYALSRETRLHRELVDQNQKLRLELQTRRDPAQIERRARDELSMAPPDPATIRSLRVSLPPGSSGASPGTAGASPGTAAPVAGTGPRVQ